MSKIIQAIGPKSFPFKLGKKPARRDAVKFKMTTYVPKLPEPPDKFGHYGLIKNWEMLGNDNYGDCVLAEAAHETMMWKAMGASPKVIASAEDLFDDEQVLGDYSAITGFNASDPSTDQGTDMEEAAKYRRTVGILDKHGIRHKIDAYLGIDKGDWHKHKVAAYLFGAVGIGFRFPAFAMDQFNAGEPWDLHSSRTQIEGGHAVPMVGWVSQDLVWIVTWARLQAMTQAFFQKYNDESIAYLSKEIMYKYYSPEKVRIRQLEADLRGLAA